MTWTYHVDERYVEEHATSESEDIRTSVSEFSNENPNHETNVARTRRQEVVHERLTHAHAGIE